MKRYQIVYSKRGMPLTTWENSPEAAHKRAEDLRKVGNTVTVWECADKANRKTEL